ncbi:MAG TPA: hypothetical protein VNS32_07260, partial [Flavisolibacter sp.]|nr:hypothetical protein [Flavisolibacter sp.]
MNLAKTIQKSEKTKGISPVKFFFQPKLAINLPGDQYEKEADTIAQQVMRMPALDNSPLFFQPKPVPVTPVQRKCAACEAEEKLQEKEEDEEQMPGLEPSGKFSIQRKCSQCEEEESVQMKGDIHATEASRDLPTVEQVVNASGSPLDT